MATRLKDVAERAGINMASVSQVLSNHPRAMELKAETRERILSIAEEMGYSRNELARAVATGHSRIIAFVSANMGTASYTGKIQEGTFAEAGSKGYAVLFYHLTKDNHQYITNEIKKWKVAGVVFHILDIKGIKDICSKLKQFDIPIAFANLKTDDPSTFGVTSDDFQGAMDVVRHLAELGHQRIAHITQDGNPDTAFVVNRRTGYLEGMKRFVHEINPRIAMTNSGTIETDVVRLLSEPKNARPTALFFHMDSWAMLSFRAVARLGLRVPEDLSIAGFGDVDMAEYAQVPLTTVSQPFTEMGKLAAAKVIEAVEKKQTAEIPKLPTKLIVRESTGKKAE